MRVVVLGASGFLGASTAELLAHRRIQLRLVARRGCTVPNGKAADVEVRRADLTVPEELSAAVAGADAIIHLIRHRAGAMTWRIPEDDLDGAAVNTGTVRGLINALRTARGAPPVCIFAGSTSQAGLPDKRRIDGTEPDNPVSAYDAQKLAAERALIEATADGTVRGTSLRLPTVFGDTRNPAARDHGIVSTMARRALAGEPLTMWHDGAVERDFLYVTDAAHALIAALDHADRLHGSHWLVGTGHSTPLRDLFASIAKAASAQTGRTPVPLVTVPPPAQAARTDFHSVAIDPSMFRNATGWKARVPLEEGLDRTVSALAEQVRQ